jgi:hypothetical protein
MSATHTSLTRHVPAVLVVVAAATARAAADDPPTVGTVRELPVISVSMEVGSTDRESKRAVYSPPPGWYVRSHRVVVARRTGTVTFLVSTVPDSWNWVTDEKMTASGKASGSARATILHVVPAAAEVAGARDEAVSDRQANTASHHALVVDVTAKGRGFLVGSGGVDMIVYAEMVYLGPAHK